jgi:hypothetical protein
MYSNVRILKCQRCGMQAPAGKEQLFEVHVLKTLPYSSPKMVWRCAETISCRTRKANLLAGKPVFDLSDLPDRI